MKKIQIILFIISFGFIFFLSSFSQCIADDTKARAIMKQVEARDNGDNMTSDMLMVLIDKNKNRREKLFKNFSKDFGEDEKRIMFVKKPADIYNTGFLTFDYDDEKKDDDQWLFLPALGKTKRIATSDKSSSFMGSDLNYSDMTTKDTDDYNYKLLKEMTINKQDVWLIRSEPKNKEIAEETGYKQSIVAVRKDNYMVIKAKMLTSDNSYTKYMSVKKLEEIDGIWVALENHIVKKQGKRTIHQTLLKQTNVKFNQDLSENLFTIRQLEKGL
ncbi:MAG: outer membrane lipoprotein-sorting protein [Desulfobacula sp.]|nr:outer membrane lipoprotein-sorting protein [Desulfobacula sp.]